MIMISPFPVFLHFRGARLNNDMLRAAPGQGIARGQLCYNDKSTKESSMDVLSQQFGIFSGAGHTINQINQICITFTLISVGRNNGRGQPHRPR